MADLNVLNTSADLTGKTLVTAEGDRTISGLWTFNRGAGAPPIAVAAGAGAVANFDADKLDGKHASEILLPTGVVLPFAGAAATSGYLICDGTAVSRSTYAALFSVIGTTFGAGDGATTFNLPDFRGRAPIGAGQGVGLTNRTLADQVGAETHQLDIGEMPSHSHPGSTVAISDPGHAHTVVYENWGVTNGGQGPVSKLSGSGVNDATGLGYTGISATATIAAQGGGGSHNNMQPSLAVNFIIKT